MTTIEAHKTYSAEAVYDRYREQFKSTLCPTSIPYEVQKKLLQEYQETNKLQGRNITRSQDSTNGQINNCIRILNASVQQIQNDKEEKMAPTESSSRKQNLPIQSRLIFSGTWSFITKRWLIVYHRVKKCEVYTKNMSTF